VFPDAPEKSIKINREVELCIELHRP